MLMFTLTILQYLTCLGIAKIVHYKVEILNICPSILYKNGVQLPFYQFIFIG